jgi:hypothetical protein
MARALQPLLSSGVWILEHPSQRLATDQGNHDLPGGGGDDVRGGLGVPGAWGPEPQERGDDTPLRRDLGRIVRKHGLPGVVVNNTPGPLRSPDCDVPRADRADDGGDYQPEAAKALARRITLGAVLSSGSPAAPSNTSDDEESDAHAMLLQDPVDLVLVHGFDVNPATILLL